MEPFESGWGGRGGWAKNKPKWSTIALTGAKKYVRMEGYRGAVYFCFQKSGV